MPAVTAPLSSTPLSRLIYILTTLSFLLISYYSYRALQYKSAVGGWWNIALSRTPSKELASAIAGAVRQHVPPASLSSIAAKETGEVVEGLLKVEEMPRQAGMVEQVMSFGGMDDDLD